MGSKMASPQPLLQTMKNQLSQGTKLCYPIKPLRRHPRNGTFGYLGTPRGDLKAETKN